MTRIRGLIGSIVTLAVIPCTAAQTIIDLANWTDGVRIDAEFLEDRLGESTATCDVNGDGLSDLVIGADDVSNVRYLAGEVSVIFGRRGKWSGTHSITTIRNVRVIAEAPYDSLGEKTSCGDVNGDAFDDLVLGASWAELGGPSSQYGKIHLIWGAPTLPSVIDLAVSPGTKLLGAGPNHVFGDRSGIGDVNGDGIGDVLAGAPGARDKAGLFQSGRVYVFFGRTTWPATLDAGTQRDVMIYGQQDKSLASAGVYGADLTGDGTAELIVPARLADGINNTRMNCGDVHVFRGRTTWPSEIDLQVQSPDMRVIGPDRHDQVGGSFESISVADLDDDGTMNLVLGVRLADGPTNTASLTGEIRAIERSASLPALVDLLTQTDNVIYGDDTDDQYGDAIALGDLDLDGTTDVVSQAWMGDGPNESRTNCGEISIVYGGAPYPSTRNLAQSPPDVLIYGSAAGAWLRLSGLSDLNGDRVPEIVAKEWVSTGQHPSIIYLISPYDLDGDGISQLPDNCPLVANADQLDTNGDGIGDRCQSDYDGDAIDDLQDCGWNAAAAGRPPALGGLSLSHAGSETVLTWTSAASADRYDLLRGSVATLPTSDFGSCRTAFDSNPTDTSYTESELPSPGAAFHYLVRGVDLACGGAGSWGTASSGVTRENTNPQDCP